MGNIKIVVEDSSEAISVSADEIKVNYYKDHSRLANRNAKDQHPISAITGLEDKLSELNNKVKNSTKDIDYNYLKHTPTFKTINGHNILGSGDIALGAGGEIITTAYPLKFAGKKLSVLGDSISTFGTPDQSNATGTWTYPGNRCRYPQSNLFNSVEYMYWKILMDKTGLELGVNDSWAGSRIVCSGSADSGDQGPNRCISSQTRIDHLGLNGAPDVIIVYGGTNDIGGSVTLGTFNPDSPITFKTLTTTPPTSPAELTDDEIADLKDTNFASACVALFIRLQRTYPDAIIICMLPNYCKSYYGTTYGKLKKYCDVLIDVCEYFGVTIVDTRKAGIGLMDMSDDTYTSALPDGIHPGIKGHQLIAEYLFNILDTHFLIPQALGYDVPSTGGNSSSSGSTSGDTDLNTETDVVTWYTNEIETAGISKLAYTAVSGGYGWAQYEAFQTLIRNKKINVVKFVTAQSSGTVTIGKVPYEKASKGELLVTKTWDSTNKGSNGVVTLELGTDITITGTEMIVFSYGQYGTEFKYGTTSSAYKGFYGRVPFVDIANGGTGTDWSLADSYTLGVDYGYKK